jgi:hypothetical protein
MGQWTVDSGQLLGFGVYTELVRHCSRVASAAEDSPLRYPEGALSALNDILFLLRPEKPSPGRSAGWIFYEVYLVSGFAQS